MLLNQRNLKEQKKKMIKLVEVLKQNETMCSMREIVVNTSHIVSMTNDTYYAGLHAEGKMPAGLHEAQQFSRVTFTNGREITVVGSPDIVGNKAKKNVLHG